MKGNRKKEKFSSFLQLLSVKALPHFRISRQQMASKTFTNSVGRGFHPFTWKIFEMVNFFFETFFGKTQILTCDTSKDSLHS